MHVPNVLKQAGLTPSSRCFWSVHQPPSDPLLCLPRWVVPFPLMSNAVQVVGAGGQVMLLPWRFGGERAHTRGLLLAVAANSAAGAGLPRAGTHGT